MPFANNSKVAGTLLLVGSVQFIMAMIIAEAVYPGYSTSANYISDLGVWSKPSAVIFNPSIILFGLLLMTGAYFIQKHFKNKTISVLFFLAGAGAMDVGIFPEDTFLISGFPVFHVISAMTALLLGGIGAAVSCKITESPFKYISVIMGVISLVANVLFLSTRSLGYLGIGAGGMERMIVYPTLLWILSFGGHLVANYKHLESQERAAKPQLPPNISE